MSKEEVKIKSKTLWIIGFIFMVVVALIIFIKVPYTHTESYTEREPYSAKDCQELRLKNVVEWGDNPTTCVNEICDRTESYCVEKNFWGNCVEFRERCISYACTKYRKYCNLHIENIDDERGTWSFKGNSIDKDTNKKTFIDNIRLDINPKRTKVGSWSFVYDAGNDFRCTYDSLVNPTKRVCENIIKYRDVERTREVIDYCNLWKKIVGKC